MVVEQSGDDVWIAQLFPTDDGVNELWVGKSREAALSVARSFVMDFDSTATQVGIEKRIKDDLVFLEKFWSRLGRYVVVGKFPVYVRRGAVDAMAEAVRGR